VTILISILQSLFLAVQFLTRIPVSTNFTVNNKQLGQSVLFYPIIGLIIGCILWLISLCLITVNSVLLAAILLAVWVAITGGLHLDGLADCSDAWAGGLNNSARSLKIMQDPHIGALAVVILMITLLLKWSALFTLLEQQIPLNFLIIIPMLARSAILILMLTADYVRPQGLGAKLKQYLPKKIAGVILIVTLILGIHYLGYIAIISMLVLVFAVHNLAKKRLGGMTGDVYGAVVELTETTLLISLAI